MSVIQYSNVFGNRATGLPPTAVVQQAGSTKQTTCTVVHVVGSMD